MCGSQAAFTDRNHFAFQRGTQLRDKLFLRAGERLPGGVVAGRGGEAENPLLRDFRAIGIFRDGRIFHRRLLCQGQRLADDIPQGIVLTARADKATLRIRLSLHQSLTKAIAGVLRKNRAVGQLQGLL